MKRKFMVLLLAFCLMSCMALDVHAEEVNGKSGLQVTFTSGGEMSTNFSGQSLTDEIRGAQPGDTINLTLNLKNENANDTNWYMTNEVLSSLEDDSEAAGGAYTYILTYTNSEGEETVLYSSDTVGGMDEGDRPQEVGAGLNEATYALEDYFYLDTYSYGQGGTITLQVVLDGETQVNSYMDTLARLQMNFAVEYVPRLTYVDETVTDDSAIRTTIVRTGDDTNLVPFFIAMACSGGLLLALAIYNVKQGKKEKRRAES